MIPTAKLCVRTNEWANKRAAKPKTRPLNGVSINWDDKLKESRMKRRGLGFDKGEKSMRVKETLLLAAWNNSIRTNSIKANINRTEKSIKFREDERINYIRGECLNLAQKNITKTGMFRWGCWFTGNSENDWDLTTYTRSKIHEILAKRL